MCSQRQKLSRHVETCERREGYKENPLKGSQLVNRQLTFESKASATVDDTFDIFVCVCGVCFVTPTNQHLIDDYVPADEIQFKWKNAKLRKQSALDQPLGRIRCR